MAKRFRFRLETVLKVRERKRDECRKVVAERFRRIARVKDRIAAYQTGVATSLEQSRDAQTATGPDVVMLRRYRAHIAAMHRLTAEAEAELRQEHDRLHEEQQRLTEANRDVKVLEKLRERQWQRHRRAEMRIEQIANDEIALQSFRRLLKERARNAEDAVA